MFQINILQKLEIEIQIRIFKTLLRLHHDPIRVHVLPDTNVVRGCTAVHPPLLLALIWM